jgi:hypothetical protein
MSAPTRYRKQRFNLLLWSSLDSISSVLILLHSIACVSLKHFDEKKSNFRYLQESRTTLFLRYDDLVSFAHSVVGFCSRVWSHLADMSSVCSSSPCMRDKGADRASDRAAWWHGILYKYVRENIEILYPYFAWLQCLSDVTAWWPR